MSMTGILLIGGDLLPFMQWWFVILCLGLIFLPLSSLIFSGLADRGYLFSKVLGIAITGFLMWMFSALKLLRFSTFSSIITVIIGLLINLSIILYCTNKTQPFKNLFDKERLKVFFVEELLFLFVFLVFTYIRGFKPEAYGTEKFMDYGFMTSMMRSDYMPPQDFWYSGTKLNYYYVGQFIATYLTRISFVKVSEGYNLMLMMIGAFAFVLPCSLGYNLIYRYSRQYNKKPFVSATLGGLLAGTGVCIAGTMHYPIYKWFVPSIKNAFSKVKTNYTYWFPNATRYIGYNPDTSDKTIHEFPSYSFILGDLHAHVINIMFVLTVLAILMSWLFRQTDQRKVTKVLRQELFNPSIIMLGFFIGLFHTTNYWDFPIYYVVSGAIILFSNMIEYSFKWKAYWLTGLQGILIFTLGKLFALPFTMQFNQISASAKLVEDHTPFYQLMVLWGLPIITIIVFLIALIVDFLKNKHKTALIDTDLFIITIGLCAIGLVLLPEIVYVKDIYSGDYKRSNTMFKLTYQAYIMFGICFGYIFIRLLKYGRAIGFRVAAGVAFLALCLTLHYPVDAVKAWYGNIFDQKGYKGIDCTEFIKEVLDFKDDYLALKWLNENISGTPVVLEANGLSYSNYQRVSVITGLPTVFGWYTHEQLWKSVEGNDDYVVKDLYRRGDDVKDIYTSQDTSRIKRLINKYDIEYIYVGLLEEMKYEEINHTLIKSLGEVVFENPDIDESSYKTYIVKVK